MSKLEYIIKMAEENIEKRSEAQHTDTTHTDYSDSCWVLS